LAVDQGDADHGERRSERVEERTLLDSTLGRQEVLGREGKSDGHDPEGEADEGRPAAPQSHPGYLIRRRSWIGSDCTTEPLF
jgi:hypothetical protein